MALVATITAITGKQDVAKNKSKLLQESRTSMYSISFKQ
jgi:hypothetical protein